MPQVVEAVFAYNSMLRVSMAAGGPDAPPERLFREVQTIENIDFLFGEEESAADWVEMLSINMHVYPPQEYITGPKLYFEFDGKVSDADPHVHIHGWKVPRPCRLLVKHP